MAHMENPLGMRGEKINEIIKSVMQMELVSDQEGFVYFNELLFRAFRRVYGRICTGYSSFTLGGGNIFR
jgi:hypothetical protein